LIDICERIKTIIILKCPNCEEEFEYPDEEETIRMVRQVYNKNYVFSIYPCPMCDQLVAIDVKVREKC
jgi:hypothetical protein